MAVHALILSGQVAKGMAQSVVVAAGLLHVGHVIDRNVIHDLLRRDLFFVERFYRFRREVRIPLSSQKTTVRHHVTGIGQSLTFVATPDTTSFSFVFFSTSVVASSSS